MATAKFIGFQDAGDGIRFRLFNIVGEHPRENSTVDIETLIAEGIYMAYRLLARVSSAFTGRRIAPGSIEM